MLALLALAGAGVASFVVADRRAHRPLWSRTIASADRVRFADSGRTVAVGGDFATGPPWRAYSTESGEDLGGRTLHGKLSWRRDGLGQVFTTSEDTLWLEDLEHGTAKAFATAPGIEGKAVSRDGRLTALVHEHEIALSPVTSGTGASARLLESVADANGHLGEVWISPRNDRVVADVNRDYRPINVVSWSVATGKIEWTLEGTFAGFAASGEVVIRHRVEPEGPLGIEVFELVTASGEERRLASASVGMVDPVSLDGQRVASVERTPTGGHGEIVVRSLETGDVVRRVPHLETDKVMVKFLELTPRGNRLLVVDTDEVIEVWEIPL